MKRYLRHFGITLTVLLMAAVAAAFLAPRFGWRVDAVLSGSMEPQLGVGSIVVSRPTQPTEIKIDDIITFRSPLNKEMTTHRVVIIDSATPPHFQTKGDACEDLDPFTVPAQNVVGRVCFHVPYVGHFAQFVKTPFGFMLVLCVPGLIVIGVEIRSIWRVLSEEETEKRYRIR